MKKIDSWSNSDNLDCFGNGNPRNVDHIWPKSKDGSNKKINKMYLSTESNSSMGDKTKGRINSYRWSKTKATTKDGDVYGVLMIRHDSVEDKTNWTQVTPILD